MKKNTTRKNKRIRKYTKNLPNITKDFMYKSKSRVPWFQMVAPKYTELNTNGNVSTSGFVAVTSGVAQGLDVNNRIGSYIYLQGISVKMIWDIGTSNPVNAMVAIVFDKASNGVVPGFSDIFTNTFPQSINHINWINKNRFTILKIGYFRLNTTTFQNYIMEWNVALNNVCTFTGTGSTNIGTGHVYLVGATDVVLTSPTLYYITRVCFNDLLNS
jgi:hypothetical protein